MTGLSYRRVPFTPFETLNFNFQTLFRLYYSNFSDMTVWRALYTQALHKFFLIKLVFVISSNRVYLAKGLLNCHSCHLLFFFCLSPFMAMSYRSF
jgi:hypothetical protein